MNSTAPGRDLAISIIFIIASSILFVPLFLYRGIRCFDFWWWMSASLIVLITAGIMADQEYCPALMRDIKENIAWKIVAGLGAACLLFAAFFIGNIMSRHMFSFAGSDINAIYGFKGAAAPVRIVPLMTLVIGPGEELFWRGFLQRRFAMHSNGLTGFMLTTVLYAGVHAASGNIMLVLAALVCCVLWGFLYYRFQSMLVNIVSHTIWDIAVFIIFPFSG
jgi:membrane protease YdiL (CAAX protease family)